MNLLFNRVDLILISIVNLSTDPMISPGEESTQPYIIQFYEFNEGNIQIDKTLIQLKVQGQSIGTSVESERELVLDN